MAVNPNPARYAVGAGSGFNKYAAGAKRYGPSGRRGPNIGTPDKSGYAERDAKIAARKTALLRRMQAEQSGNHASPDAIRPNVRRVS